MTETLSEMIGWAGASTFVTAYFQLSLKILSSEKVLYHAMNAAGGVLMSISTFNIQDRPAFFVNLIWMGIAIFSILRILLLK